MDNNLKDKNSKKWYKFIPGFGTKKRWRNVIATIFYLFSFSFILTGELGVGLFFLSIPFIFLYGFKLIKDIFQNKPKNKITKNLFLIAVVLNIIGFTIIPTGESNNNVDKPIAEKPSIEDQKEIDVPSTEEVEKEKEFKKEISETKEEKIADKKEEPKEKDNKPKEDEQKTNKENSSTNKENINDTSTENQNNNSNSGRDNNNPPQIVETPTDQNFSYVANSNTGKFHYTSCSSAKKTKESYRIYFEDRDTAISNGYSPCGRCRP